MTDNDPVTHMILNGIVEPAGIDLETGEMLYTFTEKLAQFSPPLHKNLLNYVHREIMYLWENGFVEMDVTSSNPTVRLTEKALDSAKISELPAEQLRNLKEIIKLSQKED